MHSYQMKLRPKIFMHATWFFIGFFILIFYKDMHAIDAFLVQKFLSIGKPHVDLESIINTFKRMYV